VKVLAGLPFITGVSILSTKLKERVMAKGQNAKKTAKKKPEKTMKEKRNEKKEKKANKK
jgi:hypothetical protein